MPTKIVSGPSAPQKAQINVNDLQQIVDGFTSISITSPRGIEKTKSISIPLAAMQQFVDYAAAFSGDETKSYIKIKLGVTLPDQKDCENPNIDLSNKMTIAIIAVIDGDEKDRVGHSVLTTGFKASDNRTFPTDTGDHTFCCPQDPPTNT